MCCNESGLDFENDHQKTGANIVAKACAAPFQRIMENCGLNPELIWSKIEDAGKNKGFDARTETVVDMFEAGIIDPCKVTRTALEKAASVAGTLLTTECVITNLPGEEGKEPPMAGGGFGMM